MPGVVVVVVVVVVDVTQFSQPTLVLSIPFVFPFHVVFAQLIDHITDSLELFFQDTCEGVYASRRTAEVDDCDSRSEVYSNFTSQEGCEVFSSHIADTIGGGSSCQWECDPLDPSCPFRLTAAAEAGIISACVIVVAVIVISVGAHYGEKKRQQEKALQLEAKEKEEAARQRRRARRQRKLEMTLATQAPGGGGGGGGSGQTDPHTGSPAGSPAAGAGAGAGLGEHEGNGIIVMIEKHLQVGIGCGTKMSLDFVHFFVFACLLFFFVLVVCCMNVLGDGVCLRPEEARLTSRHW